MSGGRWFKYKKKKKRLRVLGNRFLATVASRPAELLDSGGEGLICTVMEI
jgi:hypothetical protein